MADGFEEGTFDARSDCTATTSDRVRDVRPIGETTSAHRARAAQRAYHPATPSVAVDRTISPTVDGRRRCWRIANGVT